MALGAGADAFLAKPIATVGQFQETILGALPSPLAMLRSVSDDLVTPDRLAVRDDLARVAQVLAGARDAATVAYVAQFLGGLARSAGDGEIEAASRALAEGRAGALDELMAMIARRIAEKGVVAA